MDYMYAHTLVVCPHRVTILIFYKNPECNSLVFRPHKRRSHDAAVQADSPDIRRTTQSPPSRATKSARKERNPSPKNKRRRRLQRREYYRSIDVSTVDQYYRLTSVLYIDVSTVDRRQHCSSIDVSTLVRRQCVRSAVVACTRQVESLR